jgi:NADP-dependent 3-hydroxy acid dehydrogenase YdfG
VDELKGRRIAITGASGGIGEAIARAVVGAGGSVGLIARRRDRLDAIAADLDLEPARVAVAPADVTRTDDLGAAIDALADVMGGIDGVVANAGGSLFGDTATGPPEDWHRLIELDLVAAIDTVHHALRHIGDDGARDVVLIGSTAADSPHRALSAYAAAKRGLAAFGDGLRLELAPRWIRVTLVEPGAVRTDILDSSPIQDRTPEEIATTAPGRFRALRPADVARAVAFALAQAETVALNRIVIRPNGQLT